MSGNEESWKKNREKESVEKIKEATTNEDISEQLSEKSKDLFEELFGDAS